MPTNYQIVIAEKFKVAKAIASALGANVRADGYFEGNGLVVTFCSGHLVELAPPDVYDARFKYWRREDLPIIPQAFKYQVLPNSSKQFNCIKKLLERADISGVINACDAGREGELIFDLVFKSCRSSLPVQRAWLKSLTVAAIRDAFQNLRPGTAYTGLCHAAHARQRADWVVGLNATRAQTLLAREQGAGDSTVYSLGRVQTPTLALVVDRDLSIESFKATDFFKVCATFSTQEGGEYQGWWFRTSENGIVDRLESAQEADALVGRLKAVSNGVVLLVNKKTVKIKAPQLFNLAQLQREANRIHGFTIAKTLETAQSLYEKEAITYPRTSSQYIESGLNKQIHQHLAPFHGTPYAEYVAAIISQKWELKSHHVDDNKVSDHHAIIPTTQRVAVNELTNDERTIYEMIVRRFLAAFYPEAQDERTQIVSSVAGENFVTRGTREVETGWREVDPPQTAKAKAEAEETDAAESDESASLPDVAAKAALGVSNLESVKRQTKAPSRFTEGMLLSAMETAGKFVDNAEMREAMKMNGLGTDATRAAILEKLIERGYLTREGKRKFIRSTPVGRELIARLRLSEGAGAVLASPEMTGAQEAKLALIERGEININEFQEEMNGLTRAVVVGIFAQAANSALTLPKDSIPCPNCKFNGRENFLRVRKVKEEKPEEKKGKEGKAQEFLACSAPREVCGYTSAIPRNKTQAEALITKCCPVCSGAVKLRFGKEKGTPFMPCMKRECDGVVWFKTKKKSDGQKKEGAKEAA